MTCNECETDILKFEILNNIHSRRSSITECLHICFWEKFVLWGKSLFPAFPEELYSDSFSDGINALADYIWRTGLTADAKLETIVLKFCKNHLYNNARSKKYNLGSYLDPADIADVISNDDSSRETYLECLALSLKKVDDSELELIVWKHYLNFSNEEITIRLNNKIQQSKQLVKDLEAECIDNAIARVLSGEMAGQLKKEILDCIMKKIVPLKEISVHTATQRLFKAMERLRSLAKTCSEKAFQ